MGIDKDMNQNTQEVIIAQETPIAQQEEIDKLMQLSLDEIDKLPADKQELVYNEMTNQFQKYVNLHPELIKTLVSLGRMAKAAEEAAKKVAPAVTKAVNDISGIGKKIANYLSDNAEAIKLWVSLSPYINAEYDENPDKYNIASVDDLMIAAAQRAREDGVDIPPLRVELFRGMDSLPGLIAKYHVMPDNALMNVMQHKGVINAGAFGLSVLPATGKRKEITTLTMIEYTPGETDIKVTDPKLTESERQVSDAIVSLWEEARRNKKTAAFTCDEIYAAMPGGGDKASMAKAKEIEETIEKLRRINIVLNATEELRNRGILSENESFEVDEFYLQIRRVKLTAKNSKQTVTGYVLTSEPIILRYAKMTKQLLTVDTKYLNIRKVKEGKGGKKEISPELVTMSGQRSAIAGYIIRRIALMIRDKQGAYDRWKKYEKRRKEIQELEKKPVEAFRKQSNVILFDTIFEQIDLQTDDRKQIMRYRNFCFDLLEYEQAAGMIKGYAVQTKGKKQTGIEIEL